MALINRRTSPGVKSDKLGAGRGKRTLRVQKGASKNSEYVLDRKMTNERLVFSTQEARDLAERADRLSAQFRNAARDRR